MKRVFVFNANYHELTTNSWEEIDAFLSNPLQFMRKHRIFAAGNVKRNHYDHHCRKNPKKNYCKYEHATMEQDAPAGGDLQAGSYYQAQHETGGN